MHHDNGNLKRNVDFDRGLLWAYERALGHISQVRLLYHLWKGREAYGEWARTDLWHVLFESSPNRSVYRLFSPPVSWSHRLVLPGPADCAAEEG